MIDKEKIDLALVDGRFRVACTLQKILQCHENTNLIILIHDFWNRQEYHLLLKYLDIIDKDDSIGAFYIKNKIDLESVRKDYDIYKFNPN